MELWILPSVCVTGVAEHHHHDDVAKKWMRSNRLQLNTAKAEICSAVVISCRSHHSELAQTKESLPNRYSAL